MVGTAAGVGAVPKMVLIGFAVLMAAVGLRMLLARGATGTTTPDDITGARWLAVVATGAGVGFSPASSASTAAS